MRRRWNTGMWQAQRGCRARQRAEENQTNKLIEPKQWSCGCSAGAEYRKEWTRDAPPHGPLVAAVTHADTTSRWRAGEEGGDGRWSHQWQRARQWRRSRHVARWVRDDSCHSVGRVTQPRSRSGYLTVRLPDSNLTPHHRARALVEARSSERVEVLSCRGRKGNLSFPWSPTFDTTRQAGQCRFETMPSLGQVLMLWAIFFL